MDEIYAIILLNLNVEEFLSSFNVMSKPIQFKSESEVNDAIPFLDVLVICDTVNYFPIFKTYRKPTHSNSYILAFSNHPYSVKIGTITNIFLRSYIICSSKFIDKEINDIYKTFF